VRFAADRLLHLYSTSPLAQDLLETSAATAVAAGGQALMTDMSPEEIALASAAGFGAGMVGRPLVGRAGQAIGGFIDRRAPAVGEELMGDVRKFVGMMPRQVQQMYEAKLGPYAHMGGAAQYGNLLGRGYGDNAAQLAVALAAPGLLNSDEEEIVI
jgi:hypothetical protein